MSDRAPSPYRLAGELLGLANRLSAFCRDHDQRDLAGGMTYAEAHEVERQLAEAVQWARVLGTGRGPKARAAEPAPVDEQVF